MFVFVFGTFLHNIVHCQICFHHDEEKYLTNVKVHTFQGQSKGAGTSDTPSQTKEELSANDTSRHPKVLKIRPNHGCQ